LPVDEADARRLGFGHRLRPPAPPGSQGYVKLRPEDDEDMWHIYNLVQIVS
jgi:hypothetical protein